jgi:hypothetical protein
LPNRIDDVRDDGIVQIHALGQVLDQRHHLTTDYRRASQPHERPHDLDVDAHSGFAAQNAGKHRYALLGESMDLIPPAAATVSGF